MTKTPQDQPDTTHAAPTLVETLIEVGLEQEVATLAALTAVLQVAAHPGIAPRSDDELEADLDNMPV